MADDCDCGKVRGTFDYFPSLDCALDCTRKEELYVEASQTAFCPVVNGVLLGKTRHKTGSYPQLCTKNGKCGVQLVQSPNRAYGKKCS